MDAQRIGQQVEARRRELSMSRGALADAAGIAPATVRGIEQARNDPSLRTMHRVCDVLGLKITLGREGSRRRIRIDAG